MIHILFDISMPKSCAECPFLVLCDECESWENYCPLLHKRVGYDYNEPYTPKDHRHENCPLKEVEQRPHGEWIKDGFFAVCSNCDHELQHYDLVVSQIHFCPNCGADMRKEGEAE